MSAVLAKCLQSLEIGHLRAIGQKVCVKTDMTVDISTVISVLSCAGHSTVLTGESLVTGIYRQV